MNHNALRNHFSYNLPTPGNSEYLAKQDILNENPAKSTYGLQTGYGNLIPHQEHILFAPLSRYVTNASSSGSEFFWA